MVVHHPRARQARDHGRGGQGQRRDRRHRGGAHQDQPVLMVRTHGPARTPLRGTQQAVGRRLAPQGRARQRGTPRRVRRVPARGRHRLTQGRPIPPRLRRPGGAHRKQRSVGVTHRRAAQGGDVRGSRREAQRRRPRRRREGQIQRDREGDVRALHEVLQQRTRRHQGVFSHLRRKERGGGATGQRAGAGGADGVAEGRARERHRGGRALDVHPRRALLHGRQVALQEQNAEGKR